MSEQVRTVDVTWPDSVNDLPLQLGNVFAFQGSPDGIVLTVGQAVAPLANGTPDEQRAALVETTTISALPVIRLLFTPQRLQELVGGCVQVLEALSSQGLLTGEGHLIQQTPGAEVGSEKVTI